MIAVILSMMFVVGVLVVARLVSRSSRMSGGAAGFDAASDGPHPFWIDSHGTSSGSANCDPGSADCSAGGSGGGGEGG